MEGEYTVVPRREHAIRPLRSQRIGAARGVGAWHIGTMPEPVAPRIRPASAADLPEINRIYNHEVEHGVATWDLEPWPHARRERWFRERDASTPVLVAEAPDGGPARLAGFAYLSLHDPKAGYRFTREDTLYVDPAWQRRGIGRALLATLLDEARRLGLHVIIAGIEAENAASIALHRRFGFEVVGRERETGHKFGRWLSKVEMLLILDAPADAGTPAGGAPGAGG